ncbi:C4b-binding protein alpha chain-like [Lissotriton helveticus]
MAASRTKGYRWLSAATICSIWLAALAAKVSGDCGPPPSVDYAIPEKGADSDSFPVGTTVRYTCDADRHYMKIDDKSDTVSCLEDSSWSPIEQFCKIQGCGTPTRFEYGELLEQYLTAEIFPVNSIVMYKCRPGYVLKYRNIKPTLQCLRSLQWSKRPEFCNRKDCGNPGEPENGVVNVPVGERGDPDTKFGSEVRFSCNKGFRLIGRNTRTCTATGWSNAVPICDPVVCDDPPDIANGTHSGYGQEVFQYLSAVTYSCNSNYFQLSGSRVNHCTETGQWKEPAPKCKDIRCSNPVVDNGYKVLGFKSQYEVSDLVEFRCDEGFTTSDRLQIRCEEEDRWVPKVPVCRPVVCGEPPAIVNGSHSGMDRQEFRYREYVTYHCVSEDLSLIGDDNIQCIGDGYWSGKAPICKDVLCEVPHLVNGKIINSRPPLRYKSTIELECDEYFKLNGEPRIECSETSTWIPKVPECKDLRCQTPVVQNGRIESISEPPYTVWNKLTVVCNEGFIVNGTKRIITCDEDNEWRPRVPGCRTVSCSKPPDIENGMHNGTNREEYGYKETIEYRCNSENLLLVGSKTITCQENESWSGTRTFCRVVTCTDPVLKDGKVVTTLQPPFHYRHSVSLECNQNFRLVGTNNSTCERHGQWFPRLPRCQRTSCSLPFVKNGYVTTLGGKERETTFNASTYYEVACNENYTLEKRITAHCDKDYNWKNTFPSCSPILCPKPVVENGHAVLVYSATGVEGKQYRVFDKMEVSCNDGYALNGTDEIVCQMNSTWSSLPTCQFVSCDVPHVENGDIVCKNIIMPALEFGYRLSDNITFQCNDGYTMNGTNQIHCKKDSQWSTLPTCKRGSWFLPVGKLISNEDEHQTEQQDMSIETRAKKICSRVFQNINENWERMNFAERDTHLLLESVCYAFQNVKSQNKITTPQPETEERPDPYNKWTVN